MTLAGQQPAGADPACDASLTGTSSVISLQFIAAALPAKSVIPKLQFDIKISDGWPSLRVEEVQPRKVQEAARNSFVVDLGIHWKPQASRARSSASIPRGTHTESSVRTSYYRLSATDNRELAESNVHSCMAALSHPTASLPRSLTPPRPEYQVQRHPARHQNHTWAYTCRSFLLSEALGAHC